jgi:hypothetical protein
LANPRILSELFDFSRSARKASEANALSTELRGQNGFTPELVQFIDRL